MPIIPAHRRDGVVRIALAGCLMVAAAVIGQTQRDRAAAGTPGTFETRHAASTRCGGVAEGIMTLSMGCGSAMRPSSVQFLSASAPATDRPGFRRPPVRE